MPELTPHHPAGLLNERHLRALTAFGIPAELLGAAGVRSITDAEARNTYGIRFQTSSTLSGILFPYIHPIELRRVSCRLRRDHPEYDADGKPRNKYLSSYGDWKNLYFCPGARELLQDTSAPVIFVEAEKSALALTALARRAGRRWLVIATGGCWGWRGRIAKRIARDGTREDVRGAVMDFQYPQWREREAIIIFDANAANNPAVQAARRSLADELSLRGASVRVVDLPAVGASNAQINGPDDLLAAAGDQAMLELIGGARTLLDCALQQAERAIAAVSEKQQAAAQSGGAGERVPFSTALSAIAAVPDPLQRRFLCAKLAALKLPGLRLKALDAVVEAECTELQKRRQAAAEMARTSALRTMCFDLPGFLGDLRGFFSHRLWLPEGAPMLLALWTIYSWCTEHFDTAPYLCIESALPGCGKSTLL